MSIQSIKNFTGSTTARLTASYLSIIMVMSLSFSAVSYNTSSHELGRQLPPQSLFDDDSSDPNYQQGNTYSPSPRVNAFIHDRIEEGRQVLLLRLLWVNLMVLVGGSILSYYLARRTLQPIEESMEAQSQFISDASHELRTPLTAIQTTNEVALRDKKMTIAGVRTVLEQNVEEVEKLKTLTDGLLKLAVQDSRGVHYDSRQAINLQDVVSEAMNRIMKSALAKNIAIEDTTQRIMVMVDQQTIVQAVLILLDNAVKYSPQDSTIYIQTSRKSKYAMLHVIDEGPGIRPYDLRKIFDRFYRADQSRSAQHVAGNGIGLALAKKIIDQHDGELSVTSAVGKGSTFTIKLPLQ